MKLLVYYLLFLILLVSCTIPNYTGECLDRCGFRYLVCASSFIIDPELNQSRALLGWVICEDYSQSCRLNCYRNSSSNSSSR
ncbi:MAG: hypothetical protein H7A25_18240 [Leptospiraceae bacterium]|nr:hypothetical protein [Leptospiraceae bacterium]